MSTTAKTSARGRSTQRAANLPQRVSERLAQGLAPPPEAYLVENRRHIDWSQVPEWARPIDPEMFEGCSHEG
ncbi:MAG: hypothetical protein RIC55_02840 [Pirellulaceae bacterium]